ncbi:MAG: hypothetical protein EOP50_07600 [Sphingobacteriales bacterium]|nr:MAG: hypothetical protein EOP50_07600 [Sphingobacteriales bacterium]
MANRILNDPAAAGHYEWQHENLPPVSLRYNELLHSMRVQWGDERRVYLLESTEFPNARVALFNEYGLRSGACTFDDVHPLRGTVRWEEQKFRFHAEGGHITVSGPRHALTCDWLPEPATSTEAAAGILLMMAREVAYMEAAKEKIR